MNSHGGKSIPDSSNLWRGLDLQRNASLSRCLIGMRMIVISLVCLGLSGCSQPQEIEYPPEVIPEIPPGDRTNEDVVPPK
jgi:hypothetical protein